MFGNSTTQATTGDVLLGGATAGGFGGSALTSNGYGNDAASQASGGSGAPTSSGSGSAGLDLSEFPSLGGGGGAPPVAAPGAPGSNGIPSPMQQRHMLPQQAPQMLPGAGSNSTNPSTNLYASAMLAGNNRKFNMAKEDFPALSGAPVGGGSGASSLSGPTTSPLLLGNGATTLSSGSNAYGTNAPRATSGSLYGNEMESGNAGGQLEGSGLLGPGISGLGALTGLQGNAAPSSMQQRQSTSTSTAGGSTTANASSGAPTSSAGSALSGDYGLLGLLSVIRMTDADRNALALGTDLTHLGLNLNSNDNLYSSFSSPWSEVPATKEPHFQLPMCYYNEPPALKTGHLSKFQLETLFYIFHALPKDVLQAYSAQELYTREWRYHAQLKRWFKQATPADGIPAQTSSPQLLYFDMNSWERRIFTGNAADITSGFLSEEDVRVKFPQS
uniref:NOT2/NOT3/NOT5 C-terminal domain-containing protein n=1 Tax=Grammatophora oceanica TaxID=210454 RepID=A0A7S1VTU9_9STRA|mmetsp:Transcript_72/g.85  ORF Transcript_72/g.85 Transcript_72/m.85 type:complete len:444 (+) Transcript_72:240-1571(+)|eukprot:CAMPEP_0194036014 /NCGR_PEP_ID=MMETSP0009_2-20130614/8414_1 /TAXON_ID=210454 /ORGANISM="Grammatophora oceanica, Strain CCMP 410" /LENGTH=443 /DNA_ID=CAMNT_0038677603 /DNA_START=230 /DNA_END=1561 /DNA_ORIENTATION=+